MSGTAVAVVLSFLPLNEVLLAQNPLPQAKGRLGHKTLVNYGSQLRIFLAAVLSCAMMVLAQTPTKQGKSSHPTKFGPIGVIFVVVGMLYSALIAMDGYAVNKIVFFTYEAFGSIISVIAGLLILFALVSFNFFFYLTMRNNGEGVCGDWLADCKIYLS